MSTNVTPQAFTISEICDRNKTGKTKIYEEWSALPSGQ